MLSWDLHIHPGLAIEGRWGDGAAVQRSAARVGVQGFVWKSHAGSSVDQVADLPSGGPVAIPSLVLNPAIGPADVEQALRQGVRWFWGPSRAAGGSLGWELPLPEQWSTIADMLAGAGESLVLATSHLDRSGRDTFATLCAPSSLLRCTVTHSLFLDDGEVRHLAATGAAFEADLFTMSHTVRQWPTADLETRSDLVLGMEGVIYLTSDAGQLTTGDPYVFVEQRLDHIAARRPDLVHPLAVSGPADLASHIVTTPRSAA